MKKLVLIGFLNFNILWATNANYNCTVELKTCDKEQEFFDITLSKANEEALSVFKEDEACMSIDTEDINCSEVKIEDKDLSNHENTFYPKKEHTIVDVLYGTDRGLDKKALLEERYTAKRDSLKFGVAQVSIPKSHVFGEVERPFFDDNEKIGEDIVITQLYDIKQKRFSELLTRKLGKVEEHDILVFIHGYNVTFAQAIRQTAQLSYDLKFKGIPLTYSWTSQGGLSQYPKDEASVMYTVPKLVTFLEEVIKNKGKAKIHILAHSMGTRALANALKDISYLYDKPQFKNVILAAPDIDSEVFESNLYPKIIKTTEKITIYASSSDSALQASNTLHNGKRLGEGGANISVFKNVVTVDASGIDNDIFALGHSYFAQKELLVNDLRAVIHKSLPPQKRLNLIEKLKAKLLYWLLKE
ncbi:MAG TPA: alpha/beta hydrolase [Campylobacterales bacterium]|nr:alpha/beta hydrolase [Campylobacterales bacterium]